MHFHSELTPGQLAERIDGDAGALFHFFWRFLLVLLTNAVFLAGVIGVLVMKDWRIGLIFFASLSLTALAYRALQ